LSHKRFSPFLTKKNLPYIGITPDGRVVGRSLIYGGKAAEVIDIVNRGTLAEALTGKISLTKVTSISVSDFFFRVMGYVPDEGFAVPTSIILYDGAGTRLDIGKNIGAHTPANKFQDGVSLSVNPLFFVSLYMTLFL
jgi:hypothetical protein